MGLRLQLSCLLYFKLHCCRVFWGFFAPMRWSLKNWPFHCPWKGGSSDLLRCHILDFPVIKEWRCEVTRGRDSAIWGSGKEGRVYVENLLGFLKDTDTRLVLLCGINVKLDGCLSCVLSPGKVTHKYFSKILRSWNSWALPAEESKSTQTFYPSPTLLLSTEVFEEKELKETQVDWYWGVFESLQNTPITSKSQETCEREPREAPGSSCCCVSVTTEWSWCHCENDRECKAGDGRSLLLKCSPWLFMGFWWTFSAWANAHENAGCGSDFPSWDVEKIYLGRVGKESGWMRVVLLPVLSTPHVRGAPDHGGILVVGLFWGNCPVPRSEPSPQTALPQLLGVRKSTVREKTKALSAWKNRASELGISRQRCCVIVL